MTNTSDFDKAVEEAWKNGFADGGWASSFDDFEAKVTLLLADTRFIDEVLRRNTTATGWHCDTLEDHEYSHHVENNDCPNHPTCVPIFIRKEKT